MKKFIKKSVAITLSAVGILSATPSAFCVPPKVDDKSEKPVYWVSKKSIDLINDPVNLKTINEMCKSLINKYHFDPSEIYLNCFIFTTEDEIYLAGDFVSGGRSQLLCIPGSFNSENFWTFLGKNQIINEFGEYNPDWKVSQSGSKDNFRVAFARSDGHKVTFLFDSSNIEQYYAIKNSECAMVNKKCLNNLPMPKDGVDYAEASLSENSVNRDGPLPYKVGIMGYGEFLLYENSVDDILVPEYDADYYNIPLSNVDLKSLPFDGRKNLRKIQILDTVKSIGKDEFKDCENLEEILLPNTVTSIEEGAFKGCKNLKHIHMNDSVKSIAPTAFEGCESLKEVWIPGSVTSIGECAFRGCVNLRAIFIPDSVRSIGAGAFNDCVNLEEVEMPHHLTKIADDLFNGCRKLEVVGIPSPVKSIGIGAFRGCEKLKAISIPSSVKSIGEEAFDYCVNLNYIMYDNSIYNSIDSFMKVFKINELGSRTESAAKNDCKGFEDSEIIDIPSTVSSIKEGEFANFQKLRKIYIPVTVTSIEKNAFNGCTNLKKVVMGSFACDLKEGTFKNCKNLRKIDIPELVKNIEKYAFEGCESLEEIHIPNSVTSIEKGAFKNCKKLVKIHMPNYLKNLAEDAFEGCENISSIEFNNKVYDSLESFKQAFNDYQEILKKLNL